MQASGLGSDIRGCKQKTITFSYPACSQSLIPVSFFLLLFVCFCIDLCITANVVRDFTNTNIWHAAHMFTVPVRDQSGKGSFIFIFIFCCHIPVDHESPCSGAKQYVPYTPVELWDDWCGSISNNNYQKYLWNRHWIGLNTGPSLSFRAVSFHMLSSCGNMLIICHVVAQTWVAVVQSDHRTQ